MLSACGGGGGGGGNFTPPSSDFLAPSVSFSPNSLTVESGGTGSSTVSARDNVGVVSGPIVTCTRGGSFANSIFTAPTVTQTTISVCTATATDAQGNEGRTTLSVTITPPGVDTQDPVVTFNPTTLTVAGGDTGRSTLTATDNNAIDSGPTVICTNGGSFANNVFTAPAVTGNTTSVCTATASDAAGNSDDATLTVSITPTVSAFFVETSDTITVDAVIGSISIPTDPAKVVGLSKNTSTGAVSAFAVTATGINTFEDAVVTATPTLGSVGTAPLDILFADLDGEDGGQNDLIFFDEVNSEIVGLPLNADNSFGTPITQSVPNGCDMGLGSGTLFVGTGDDSVRADILVGTTDGLYYVAAGDADGTRGSGLSTPTPIVSEGNFCNLFVSGSRGDTTYAFYDSSTQTLTSFEGENSDATSYEQQYTADISSRIAANVEPLLFDGFIGPFGLASLYSVFDNAEGRSTLLRSAVRGTQITTEFFIDLDTPTDMAVFEVGTREQVILVNPNSEYAVYVRNSNLLGSSLEVINIGLGFDQVEVAANAIAFYSSTKDDIVIRKFE